MIIAGLCRYPKRKAAEKHAWNVLAFTGLADQASKSAASLTLAGRKRLEISKALALEPSLMLLDEVVAGLNPTEADKTIDLILREIAVLLHRHLRLTPLLILARKRDLLLCCEQRYARHFL